MAWFVLKFFFVLGWWPLPFSLEWWGQLLVGGVWFPSHLQPEGADRIRILGHNRWPTVPEV
jgi:hypothetical protein